ncbi:3-dehydroquinate synthase [Candidatus Sumerlaeota bacterium]|nr:3-dehydroquinate synthase [Candidatus Sumerlaeota bacterium]
MEKLRVKLGDRSYDILISTNWLSQLGKTVKGIIPREKILIVTDDRVGNLYGDEALESLRAEDLNAEIMVLPHGEDNKNLATVERIYNFLVEYNYARGSTLVALGGGVVGDITGFAAATYMRGINYIQVPTSLMAMVDSSVGGKTGVNHPLGKNLIGSFYQPKLVFTDTVLLETLAPEEFRSGMAEVIKYGIIRDADFFELIEDKMESLIKGDVELLGKVIRRCCEIKAEVVSADERESGLRAILNFGHTVGHAIEALTNYRKYRHGEAVAIGMLAAARIAVQMKMFSEMETQRLWKVITRGNLPYQISNLDPEDIMERMKKDKKARMEYVRFALPSRIGETEILDDVPGEIVLEVLKTMTD